MLPMMDIVPAKSSLEIQRKESCNPGSVPPRGLMHYLGSSKYGTVVWAPHVEKHADSLRQAKQLEGTHVCSAKSCNPKRPVTPKVLLWPEVAWPSCNACIVCGVSAYFTLGKDFECGVDTELAWVTFGLRADSQRVEKTRRAQVLLLMTLREGIATTNFKEPIKMPQQSVSVDGLYAKDIRSQVDLLINNLVNIKDETGEFLLRLPDGRVIDTKGWNDWEWTHGIGKLIEAFKSESCLLCTRPLWRVAIPHVDWFKASSRSC